MGRTALSDTLQGWHPTKIILGLLNLERTLDKRRRKEGGSGEETTAKKVVTLQRAMTKKVISFLGENRGDTVTPSVSAAGDTNLSDATVLT